MWLLPPLLLAILVVFSSAFPFPPIQKGLILPAHLPISQYLSEIPFHAETQWLFVTYSAGLENDGYLALYLGHLARLLEKDHDVLFLIILRPETESLESTIVKTFPQLPLTKTILLTCQHGSDNAIPFSTLHRILHLNKLQKPAVIFHVNHEQPWYSFDDHQSAQPEVGHGLTALQKLYMREYSPTSEQLLEEYRDYPLILRNYYYRDFFSDLSNVKYLPLGLPHDGFVFHNTSSQYSYGLQKKESSSRPTKCFFRGRTNYVLDENLYNPYNGNRERQLLHSLYHSTNLSQYCILETADDIETQAYEEEYIEYTQQLFQSAIVLCPAGNNPETFRLHEVLETGGIPVIVRTTDEKINFMNHELWREYPGPILGRWDDLTPFLQSLDSSSELDQLQEKILRWYERFQQRVSDYLRSLLLERSTTPISSTSSHLPQEKADESMKELLMRMMAIIESQDARIRVLESSLSELKNCSHVCPSN